MHLLKALKLTKLQPKNTKYQIPNTKYQSGQSLIETIAAIFILTTALTGGLGLTIYAFSVSSLSQNEVIAANLAREGVEVVRMMRDSNWLASDVKGGPWDLTACSDIGDRLCYPRTYQQAQPYNNYDLSLGNQRAVFSPGVTASWSLSNTPDYDLNLISNGSGVYVHSGSGFGGTVTPFARMINISLNANPPYTNQNSNQELIVKSVVAWRGKNCPIFNSSDNLLLLVTNCKVVVEEHLTNWKDYK